MRDKMTPLHLGILFNYYALATEYDFDSEVSKQYADELAAIGLLYTPISGSYKYRITGYGQSVCEQIMAKAHEIATGWKVL